MMRKYKFSDQAKQLLHSCKDHDDFSVATEDSSIEKFSPGSTKSLNFCEQECMVGLRQFSAKEGIGMSEQLLFRFACFHRFNLESAKEAVFESRDNAFLNLEMHSDLRSQFVTKILFPLTGLRTKKHNSQVIYGRPSRSEEADEDNMTKVLENLCYVMNDFSQTEQQCRDGVAIVVNLKGFKIEHFDELEWKQFVAALQGALVPTRVTSVLFVNPPSGFQKDVWKKLKSGMPYQVRRNVHIITSDKLGDYLMEDYRAYLPTDLSYGYRNTEEIIEDYIDLKSFEEKQKRRLMVQ
jgi:hypothetical protein